MSSLIESIGKKNIGNYSISLKLKQARHYEQKLIDIYLVNEFGNKTIKPAISGLYSRGRKPYIKSWMDLDYMPLLEFKNGQIEDFHNTSEERKLFELLGTLIEPNGSLMISYEMFSREHEIHFFTKKQLEQIVPSVLTPIGQLLLFADCWSNIRDWYIPEGGMEGNKKLQGFKPFNQKIRKKRQKTVIKEIKKFILEKEMEEFSTQAVNVELHF